MILTIRTDKPEAEIGLHTPDGRELSYYTWPAHRQLAATLLSTIHAQLAIQKASFEQLTGIVVYKGPGSFTGLRIGITVANSLAYGLTIPIVGTLGEEWRQTGLAALASGKDDKQVLPEYGAEAHITLPRQV